MWEEDFEIEPFVEGGARIFRRLHTPGYEGWTISRYRQTGGRMPEGDPEHILEDMDLDGVDVQVMHPNLSLFGLYSDDHELSMAHARVYNDYVIERFTPYFVAARADRAGADHRHRRRGRRDRAGRGRRVPRDPAAGDPAEAVLLARLRPGVGGRAGQRRARVHPHADRRREGRTTPTATTLKVVMETAAQVNQPMTEKSASKRMITQCVYGPIVPQQLMCELIGGGVPERYPDLHFALIEFNAHWLASLVGSMDKCWVTGIGQDADWWLGGWDDTRPTTTSPTWRSCSGSTRSGRTR